MKRDLGRISDHLFDLCIIGGGIYGACVARDATLRGLSVALVEKADFGHATSSNTLRIIHGGFRYLRHGDVIRIRESVRELKAWMRIAPHLVRPLPVLIPTYQDSIRSQTMMSLALLAYHVMAFDRNRPDDPPTPIPRGRVMSREECLRLVPELDARNLTGAAMFYDGQVYNSERLLLACLKSAARKGAVVANYVEATGLLVYRGRVTGVRARDVLTGEEFDIKSRTVVNAAGPWVDQVLDRLTGRPPSHPIPVTKAINVIVNRRWPQYAVGVGGGRSRLLFVTPWRDHSLIGTAHLPYSGGPDTFRIRERDVREFVDTINTRCPAMAVGDDDIQFFHGGLVPSTTRRGERDTVKLMRTGRILNHRTDAGVEGLLSVVGVKATAARNMSEMVVDEVFGALGYRPPISTSAHDPVHGGLNEPFDSFLLKVSARPPRGLTEQSMRHLVLNYGSAYPDVVRHAANGPHGLERIGEGSEVLRAEVLHGVRDEMAQKLSDVVFRRTELGTLGNPGDALLATCAAIMSAELGWDKKTIDEEVNEVKAAYVLERACA